MTEPTRQTIRALHDFLVRAFNGEELKALFYYSENPALREVEGQFLHGESLSAWVQKAISYCERHDLIGALFAEIEAARPGQFEGMLAVEGPPSPPDVDTLPEPGTLPPGSRMPFARNAVFTGRVRPLLDLARALLHGGAASTVVTQAVQGMGGIGKTQLAVEFAYRYGRYFRGVHWIAAAQPDLIGAEIAASGAKMLLPGWPSEQPRQVELTLRAWQDGGPRLVILDNLEGVEAARQWLHRLQDSGACLVLTARRSDWPADLGLAAQRLDLFTPGESVDFFRQTLPPDRAPDADLEALAERLGRLPLALELAARYLHRHRRLSVPDYLGRLDDLFADPAMAGWREDLGNPTGHDLDLAGTFRLSWEEVEERDARRLFLAAGHCAPNQPIPCEVLESAVDLERDACDAALSILTGLGLLEMADPVAGPAIHPLLAEYARSLPGAGEALAGLAGALRSLAGEANQTLLPAPFLPLRAHVEAAAPAAEAAAVEDAGTLWNELGLHLKMVADYPGARAAYERALEIWAEAHGENHPRVATAYNNLGLVLKDLGDLAGARAAYERALDIDEAVYGPDHPQVALRVNNLGGVLYAQGDLAGARAAYERVLDILARTLPPVHPYVASAHGNLGFVLKAEGDLAGARAACERALAIDEAVYGPDHPKVAIDFNNLGLVLKDLGDLAGARAACTRALAMCEAVLGPDHPSTQLVRDNLASLGD